MNRHLTAFENFDGLLVAGQVFTGARTIQHGGVRISRGRIVEICSDCRASSGEGRLDYPTGLIHPGLVNAHCHLDLSGSDPVSASDGFTGWLERVRESRLGVSPQELATAAVRGLDDLVSSGSTALADFSFGAVSESALESFPVDAILLREVIGLTGEHAARAVEEAGRWLDGRVDTDRVTHGLAPHAPYSAGAAVIGECRRRCGERPLAIHVAEDPDEAVFLTRGEGPFRAFLERLEIPLEDYELPGCRPVPYLDRLGVLGAGTMLIHANDLTAAEVELVALRDATVVFCPGTHRYFDRPRHPLPDLLAAGVAVGLGTDSPASNRSRSVAAEMREVCRLFPGLGAEVVWRLGMGVALARFFPAAGRIEVGDPANLAVADLGAACVDPSPLEVFLGRETTNLLTLSSGRVVYRHGGT